jgi:mannosyltransferase
MIENDKKVLARINNEPLLQYALLAAITLLAAALRFYKLGEWSFWIDEIFTLNRASVHVNIETIISQWWHPSISLILTNLAIENLGISEWSARLVPALIGILTIPILFFPIRSLFNPVVALLTGLLLAVSPWHLEWSQNARFYTSLLVIYFLAAYAFYLAIEKDKLGYLFLSGILLILAIGERFVAAFLVPAALVYLLLLALLPFEKPSGYRPRIIAFILVPIIGFALLELVRFLSTGSSYVSGAAELSYSLPISDPFRLGSFIAFDIGIALITLAFFAGIYLLLQRNRVGLFVLLNAVVPVVLLLLINPFYFTKDRYVFMVLPFWLILAAVAVERLYVQTKGSGKIVVIGVLALLVADAAGDGLLYYQINHGNRHDWKGAFTLVQDLSQPGDQYVTWWPQFYPYYLDQEIIPYSDLNPEIIKNTEKRYWFILDEETIWGNGLLKAWLEQNGELIDIKYSRTPNDAYLRIYLYDPTSK